MSNYTNLARDFKLDIEDPTTPGVWLNVPGVSDLNPQIEAEMQDDSDYDSEGWKSETKTAQGSTVEVTINRKRDVDTSAHAPSHEVLRRASVGFRGSNQVKFRYYDKLGGAEAYQGTANVQWERANSNYADLDAAKVTLTTTGPLAELGEANNPANATQKPIIVAVNPATVALAGGLVVLKGNRFLNVSAVTVDGSPATFQVISNNLISIIADADSAGTVDVVATNPVGASDAATLNYSA